MGRNSIEDISEPKKRFWDHFVEGIEEKNHVPIAQLLSNIHDAIRVPEIGAVSQILVGITHGMTELMLRNAKLFLVAPASFPAVKG